MHKTCGDHIRTLVHNNPPETVETAIDLVDAILASSQRALQTLVHGTLGVSPGTLAFGRDMKHVLLDCFVCQRNHNNRTS